MVGRDSITLLFLATMLLGWTWPEQPVGWYLKAGVGYASSDRLKEVEGSGANHENRYRSLSLKDSLTFGGKIGYRFEEPINLELEYFSVAPHIESQWFVASNASGSASGNGIMKGWYQTANVFAANLLLRGPWKISPYLGGGPALVFAEQSDHLGGTPNTSLGLHVLVGLDIPIAERLGVFAEIKNLRTRLGFNDSQGAFAGDINVTSGMMGITYRFGR